MDVIVHPNPLVASPRTSGPECCERRAPTQLARSSQEAERRAPSTASSVDNESTGCSGGNRRTSIDDESNGCSANNHRDMKSSLPIDSYSQSFLSEHFAPEKKVVCTIDDILAGIEQEVSGSSSTRMNRRQQSDSSSEIPHEWNERRREDPVGDLITRMLNDGRVPNFGYARATKRTSADDDDTPQLFPLFTSRNCRAIRKLLLSPWKRERNSIHGLRERLSARRERRAMRFILESFLVIHIAIYSINDILLRSASEFVLFALLWSISTFLFNVDEVKHVSCSFFRYQYSLARSVIPQSFIAVFDVFVSSARELLTFVVRTFFWGNRFQGRTLLWSDEETLLKFRKEHGRLLTLIKKLKRNRKERRKLRKEKRRRHRWGEAFTKTDMEKMAAENDAGEQLKASIDEFARKSPTFFRGNADSLDPGITTRHNATKRHMESLLFCQKMISSAQEEQDPKPVSIQMEFNSNGDIGTPLLSKDTIEVVDQFPDIDLVDNFQPLHDEGSDGFLTDDYSDILTDDSSSFEDDDDDCSIDTRSSDSTARSMPWIRVGAKIGHKLLGSRRLQRVIANPDAAQKLISEEAKKFIGELDEDRSLGSQPSKSKPFDDSKTKQMSQHESVRSDELHNITHPHQIKPPIHCMRNLVVSTSATTTLNSYYDRETLGYMSPLPVMEFMPGAHIVISEKDTHEIVTRVPVKRLAPIEKGVKMVVPMFSLDCPTKWHDSSFYQMGTVISSRRIYIAPNDKPHLLVRHTNCLSIKIILDKAFLRGGKFAVMNLRVMDEWNLVPRHSKFPIGSCVATTFGVGVLVGWRAEDDCHIIRSLWKRGGPGTGSAYLRRDSIHKVVEAAVGFDVHTTFGIGNVVAYVRGGARNTNGKYLVSLTGRRSGQILEFDRSQILSCHGAAFAPVTEQVRAAAIFRLQILQYKAKNREQRLNSSTESVRDKGMWRNFSEYVDLFANSLSKAIADDPDFESEFDKFVSYIIELLDGKKSDEDSADGNSESEVKNAPQSTPETEIYTSGTNPIESWNINEIIQSFFVAKKDEQSIPADCKNMLNAQAFDDAHESAKILIRVLLRTVSVAKAAVPNRPKLHIVLAMIHEILLFVKQILKVQQVHTSKKLIEAWFRALHEISDTFGPLKERVSALGVQIGRKLRKHGSVAKRRILRFVDIILGDTQLLHALELGHWSESTSRIELAIVKAGITDAASCEKLHSGIALMYKNLAPRKKDKKTRAAASRNSQKLVQLAKLMNIIATPGRSFLRLLTRDEVLVLFDRVLVRVFEKDPTSSMIINIMAFNFDTIRHLRTLNNMSIAGKLWETVLDAIDEELTFATSEIPEQTKYFLEPCVKLFSLGVANFHNVQSGSSTADWLDFLLEDEAVTIIQEVDFKLIHSLEALCNDVKQVFQVLPYINTIDNDILDLIDEFDFDEFLKDITDVIGNPEKWIDYMNEKSTTLVERFLDYLPKMAIPIDKLPLQDGWVLTCRSRDGGDLRLSDLSVLREDLILYVFGGDNLFLPLGGLSGKSNFIGSPQNENVSLSFSSDVTDDDEEESVLDEVRELILSAQSHGAWVVGTGGLKKARYYDSVPHQLAGFPLSDRLKAQLDLWQSAAISDFQLLESAIGEVTRQIQLQKEREENGILHPPRCKHEHFDPKSDPTILFLDIKNLTLRLEDFGFRVEKAQPKLFDPVFEGRGSIAVKNVSITLKVEIKKRTMMLNGLNTLRPILQLSRFEIRLEKLKLGFQETGADWFWNALLKGFRHQITDVVQANLKENIKKQIRAVLAQANEFIDANPHLLNTLGISMKDLEESSPISAK